MYHHNSGLVTSKSEDEFKPYIRDIHGFPKKGVIFRDITNLLKNGDMFQKAVDRIAYRFHQEEIDVILFRRSARIYSRGSNSSCARCRVCADKKERQVTVEMLPAVI